MTSKRCHFLNLNTTTYKYPLVILTNSGMIVVPAHLTNSVTIPNIANSNSAVTCSINDLARGLDMNTGGHMLGRFLKVELTGKINDNITNEDKKQGYSEAENSGFNAKFCQIVNNQGQIEDIDYPGTVVLNLDFKAMGVSLADPSPDKNRFFYAAHNYKEASVEYLPLSVSSDKLKGTVSVSSLSPFAIVYKDAKRPEPSSPSYKPPKTGN